MIYYISLQNQFMIHNINDSNINHDSSYHKY